MKHGIYIILLLGLFLQSCTHYRPLTSDLRKEYGWTERDLKKMQFYLSRDVVLRQVRSGGLTEIQDGKVKVIDGKKVKEIVIKEGTPGVLLFMPESNRMAVSFETGDNDRFLIFGPNPNYDGKYMLLAAEWDKNRGIVTYNGDKYATSTYSALAGLLINMKDVIKVRRKTHVAGGRTVE